MKFYGVCVILAGLALLACGEDRSRQYAGSVQSPVDEVYEYPEGNLLINPEFVPLPNGRLDAWSLSQHAGAASYKLVVEGGVVGIQRIDKEPWGTLRQIKRTKAMVPLQGKRLRFSAELKEDFNQDYGAPFEEAGLALQLTGIASGQHHRDLLFSQVEPVQLGSPWRRYTIDVDIPDAASASWLELEVKFVMTHGGTMSIRRPYLVEVEKPQGE